MLIFVMDVKKCNGVREIEEDILFIVFFLYVICFEIKIMEMRNRRWSCFRLENEEDISFIMWICFVIYFVKFCCIVSYNRNSLVK